MTLDRPDMGRYLTVVPLPERLRTVLSQEEAARLLEAAPGTRAEKLARARQLIAAAQQIDPPQPQGRTCDGTTIPDNHVHPCPHCGSRMVIIETFEAGRRPRHHPSMPVIRINTS